MSCNWPAPRSPGCQAPGLFRSGASFIKRHFYSRGVLRRASATCEQQGLALPPRARRILLSRDNDEVLRSARPCGLVAAWLHRHAGRPLAQNLGSCGCGHPHDGGLDAAKHVIHVPTVSISSIYLLSSRCLNNALCTTTNSFRLARIDWQPPMDGWPQIN